MNWRDLPTSSNVEVAPDIGWIGRDVAATHPDVFGTAPKMYGALRQNYLYDHPPTSEQKAWTDAHMPASMPTALMMDPSIDDPSIMARRNMPSSRAIPMPYRANPMPWTPPGTISPNVLRRVQQYVSLGGQT